MSNRLLDQQSPYLLQHKDNPVDWWAWSTEAFDAARAQDKPIFLSVGYSTCHWCHVMAHESFEDEEVAHLMNETFINIKVDREERPDVDQIYMTVCQMMTGQGGWPLTVLMTPEKKPFFSATYIPKHSRHGRLGMLDLIPRIHRLWRDEPGKVLASAEHITDVLKDQEGIPASGQRLEGEVLEVAYKQLQARFDPAHGGFGTAPKFPAPHNLLFLLRYWKRTGVPEALAMAEATLHHMRLGGVYDHLGYGFHRYATDRAWKLPHFEKMLYDQALLALAYTEAFQATRKEKYGKTAREILMYVLRDMVSPEGAFYSAEDADSEGREGTFYVWSVEEIRAVLEAPLAELVIRVYSLESQGNFEEEATRQRTGENILYLRRPLDEVAEGLREDASGLHERLEKALRTLFEHREARIRPGLDDKVLVDWNGLMIAAFARAGQVLGEDAYLDAARNAARFLLQALRTPDGRLVHRYRNGEAGLQANLDDYAYFVWGLLELYEATFEVLYLQAAVALNTQQLRHFWDAEQGAFFFAPDDGEALLIRAKEAYDGAIPSGNSVAMLNLLRLSRLTGDTTLEQQADQLGAFFADVVRRHPSSFTGMLLALDFAVGPSVEVVLAGRPEAPDTLAMIKAVREHYLPNKVVHLRPDGDAAADLVDLVPYVEAQSSIEGQATAYVCQHFACEQPTTDVRHLETLLEEATQVP